MIVNNDLSFVINKHLISMDHIDALNYLQLVDLFVKILMIVLNDFVEELMEFVELLEKEFDQKQY
jgi:hypothetical protein